MRLGMPRSLVMLESRVREQVRKRVPRGFVSGSVKVAFSSAARRNAVIRHSEQMAAPVANVATGLLNGIERDARAGRIGVVELRVALGSGHAILLGSSVEQTSELSLK